MTSEVRRGHADISAALVAVVVPPSCTVSSAVKSEEYGGLDMDLGCASAFQQRKMGVGYESHLSCLG